MDLAYFVNNKISQIEYFHEYIRIEMPMHYIVLCMLQQYFNKALCIGEF
jgi:hypothetical protein